MGPLVSISSPSVTCSICIPTAPAGFQWDVNLKNTLLETPRPLLEMRYKHIFSILLMNEIIPFCLLFPVPLQWQGQYLHEATSHLHNNQNMARTLEKELKEQTEMSEQDLEDALLCRVASVYTPASTRLSVGRKLQRYWDIPVRHNRQRQRDGPQGDKRQPRLCWCSLGRQLSTHLSAGHTCKQREGEKEAEACLLGKALSLKIASRFWPNDRASTVRPLIWQVFSLLFTSPRSHLAGMRETRPGHRALRWHKESHAK